MTKCGMDDVFKEGSDDFGFGFNDRCGGELSASGCEFIALSRNLKLGTAFFILCCVSNSWRPTVFWFRVNAYQPMRVLDLKKRKIKPNKNC